MFPAFGICTSERKWISIALVWQTGVENLILKFARGGIQNVETEAGAGAEVVA